MDWRSWFGFSRSRRAELTGAGGRAWRWRTPDFGRRLGTYGRGAPRLELPSVEEIRQVTAELRERYEAYQRTHPYQVLAGDLAVGLVLGLIVGRWMARAPR